MRIEQEPEHVHGRAVVVVALLALLATAIGVLVAWQLVIATRRPISAAPGFRSGRSGSPPVELNGVEMAPFPAMRSLSTGAREAAGSQQAALRSTPAAPYGWTDRSREIVHIPIDRAKELYLSRHARSVRAEAPAKEGALP